MISAVKIAYKEYFTMDDYSTELDMEEPLDEDLWAGEDEVHFVSGVPEALWSDHQIDLTPTQAPEPWLDELADKVEIERLCSMGVLVRADEFAGEIHGKLTTKFVRDWRLKPYGDPQNLRWMLRRSRFVAKKVKRLDTFSPATGCHTANILPLQYLWLKDAAKQMKGLGDYDVVLGCLGVKDAVFMVDQDEPISVKLQGQEFVIRKILRGTYGRETMVSTFEEVLGIRV